MSEFILYTTEDGRSQIRLRAKDNLDARLLAGRPQARAGALP